MLAKLVLYLICRVHPSTSAQTLATDHLNDTFSNSVALLFSSIGTHYWKPADPIGAIIISVFIITNWIIEVCGRFGCCFGLIVDPLTCIYVFQGSEHIRRLGGLAASPALLQQLTLCAAGQGLVWCLVFAGHSLSRW